MKIRLSARKLVDFACRSGDLSGFGVAGPTAQEGIKAHQAIQSKASSNWSKEVRLSVEVVHDEFTVELTGRVDLLDDSDSPCKIREIKSTLVPPDKLDSSTVELQRAQLKLYGFIYLMSLQKDKAGNSESQDTVNPGSQSELIPKVQNSVYLDLLWINLLDQQQTIDSQEFQFSELSAFVDVALGRYLDWHREVSAAHRKMCQSASLLQFPFDQFRAGQRDMAAAVYRAFRDGETLLCEAPTGIGKTISTLFPAVKALGEGGVSKVVYLTAKTSGRQAAFDAIESMKKTGLNASSLVIQSKAVVCHCSNGKIDREADGRCPYTLGFFDRLPEARRALFRAGSINADLLDKIATEYRLCPFELSIQMLSWVDVAICDYNYVFDPLVRLSFFPDHEKSIGFLVDEAHNLPDRARSMYSARLSRSQIQQSILDCRATHALLAKRLEGLNRAMDRWNRQIESDDEEVALDGRPDTVTRAVEKVLEVMQSEDEGSAGPTPDSVGELFRELFRFRVIEELFDDQHRTLISRTGSGKRRELVVRLVCLNASDRLRRTLKAMHSTVMFSATLRPQAFHSVNLGLEADSKALVLESPFDSRQMACLVCSYIDTRYRQRQDSIEAISELVYKAIRCRPGNYMVFFPSYRYLQQVCDRFMLKYPAVDIAVQQRQSGDNERAEFLKKFEQESPVVGFAIMGGIYGEGVDFVGERLVGAIIIGTGLPSPGVEQNLVTDDYRQKGYDSFDYAYRYPGFTRVMQTAGRVIRKESDRGIVILVDNRFSQEFYKELYPSHWNVTECASQMEMDKEIKGFWEVR